MANSLVGQIQINKDGKILVWDEYRASADIEGLRSSLGLFEDSGVYPTNANSWVVVFLSSFTGERLAEMRLPEHGSVGLLDGQPVSNIEEFRDWAVKVWATRHQVRR